MWLSLRRGDCCSWRGVRARGCGGTHHVHGAHAHAREPSAREPETLVAAETVTFPRMARKAEKARTTLAARVSAPTKTWATVRITYVVVGCWAFISWTTAQ